MDPGTNLVNLGEARSDLTQIKLHLTQPKKKKGKGGSSFPPPPHPSLSHLPPPTHHHTCLELPISLPMQAKIKDIERPNKRVGGVYCAIHHAIRQDHHLLGRGEKCCNNQQHGAMYQSISVCTKYTIS